MDVNKTNSLSKAWNKPYVKYYVCLTVALGIILAVGLIVAKFPLGLTPADVFSHKAFHIALAATLPVFYILFPGGHCFYKRWKSNTDETPAPFIPPQPTAAPPAPAPPLPPPQHHVEHIPVPVTNQEFEALFAKIDDWSRRNPDRSAPFQTRTEEIRWWYKTQQINGRNLKDIDAEAKPKKSSTAGFIAENETVLGVILRDHFTLMKLGITGKDLISELSIVLYSRLEDANVNKVRVNFTSRLPKANWTSFSFLMFRTRGGVGGGQRDDLFKQLDNWGSSIKIIDSNGKIMFDLGFKGEGEFPLDGGSIDYIKIFGFFQGNTHYRVDPTLLYAVLSGRGVTEIEKEFGVKAYPGKQSEVASERTTVT